MKSDTLTTSVMQQKRCMMSELPEDNFEVNVEAGQEFLHQVDNRLTFGKLRHEICRDFEEGVVDAETTLLRLEDNHMLNDVDQLAQLVCAGIRALYGSSQDRSAA